MPQGTVEPPLTPYCHAPRDCGHDCSVCRVTVVGLTEYAGHISSRQHKLNVEASEGRAAVAGARDGEEMDYFDQALMDLIQKRKELIRKDEEAAAAAEAQLAREESERRRQQDFQDRLREAKERFRLNLKGRKPPRGYGAPRGPEAWGPGPGAVLGPAPGWGSGTHPAARGAEDPRVPYRAAVRTNGRGGEKSATWHAAAPAPGFQAAAGQWAGGSLGSGSKGFGPGDPFGLGAPRGRHPWLSNQGSSNGLYGRNNIRQQPPMGPPLNLGPLCGPARPPSPAGLFTPRPKGSPDLGGAGAGECHRGNDPGPKSHGPPGSKPDRACRWSPYPPTAAAAKAPEREAPAPPPPPPPPPDVPRTCHGGRGPARPGPVQREERPGRAGAAAAAAVAVGDRKKTKPPKMDEDRKRSTSGGRPSGGGGAQKEAHRDGPSACSSGPPKPPPDGRKLAPKDRKFPLNPPSSTDKPRPDRPPGREKKQPPPPQPPKPKTTSSRAGPAGPLQSRQDQQIPDQSGVARPERRGSEGAVTGARRKETPPPPPPPPPAPAPSSAQEEARPQVSPESREGADKENKRRMSGGGGGAKDLLPLPDLVRPSHRGPTARTHADCSEYLQSVHVSTSSSCAPETPTPVVSSTQEEKEQQQRRRRQQQEEEEEESSSTPKAPQNPSGGLTRLGLPPVLSKHMGAKGSKVPAHEPNLHGARRVRHVGDGGGGGGEKESGLKPTVRQLISSSGSRRNVNWEQVYQEVRKKQGQGKGCPRFGIEMVSCDQEDPAAGEDPDAALLEGFHWDSLLDSAPCLAPRKRSLSESSVAPARPASSLGLFSCQVSGEPGGGPSGPEEDREAEEHKVFSNPGASEPAGGVKEEPEQPGQEPMEVGAPGPAGAVKEGRGAAPPRKAESLEVGGPGAELLDATAMGKKRRAAGDISSPEIHSLKKNKRMKIKSKKERFHVDQLLAVSLREEELSLSLQTLDMGLIQARSTLQAAYMEVQRIMVEKNQVSTEMAALRNQRIELLKGIQGVFEEPAAAAAAPQVKQESGVFDSPSPSAAAAVDVSIPLARPAPPSTLPTLPPRHGTPDDPGVVKQEPLSPVQVGGVGLDHQEPAEIRITLVHSTAPLTPAPLNAPILTDAVKLQWSPDRGPVADPPSARPQKVPAPCKDSPPAAVAIAAWNATPDRCGGARQDCKLEPEPWASPRRTSEVGNHGDGTIRSDESGTSPEAPPPPRASTASPEMRNGFAVKRVRRLRKRRVLNKVQGAEPAAGAATSEEEEEDDEAKPRRPRPRRRSSAGSVVSTSALPTGPEDEEHGAVEEEEEEEEEESPGPTAGMGEKEKEEEFDSALEMVEVGKEEANADWSGPEEAMEVTLGLGLGPGPVAGLPPDPSRSRSLNLACNEVTSTSDMDTSAGGPPCPSDGQAPFPPAKDHKTKLSSDASSDPGDDEPPTEGTFEGHKEAVNDLQIHRGLLYTCSGDRTVKAFDLVTHECVAVFEGHLSKVNCMLVLAAPGLPHRLYSGSSDQRVRCYSLKTRVLEQQYVVPHRVLCLHSRWKVLYAGLANGTVATFNLKTNRPMEVFECHGPRAVSCLTSAQEGARKVLLVGSYDSTISVRDARNGLLLRTLEGHAKTVLCMKVVNDLVFSGSSDHSVHAHNIHTGELVRVYKGHSHAVSVVAILGKVMLTASLDKLVRVYELQSHDRLQVYGGHKDMVMCMTVHKSMIYTGCYDGSVQAVKLNLLQNYRCMWQGCPLIFGVLEHLRQHLEDAHANPSFQTLKCRWKNCDELFCARNGAKPGVATHMQKHIDELASSDP